MKIYGPLEVAQLEWYTNAGKPAAAAYAFRIIYVTDLSQIQVSDGSNWLGFAGVAGGRLAAMFDCVIGSAAQVTSGVATHSTWASAISACPSGGQIFVMDGTITENVTLTKSIKIIGKGNSSVLDGTFTFSTSSDKSTLQDVKLTGDCTINSTIQLVLVSIRQSTGKTVYDNGTGSSVFSLVE